MKVIEFKPLLNRIFKANVVFGTLKRIVESSWCSWALTSFAKAVWENPNGSGPKNASFRISKVIVYLLPLEGRLTFSWKFLSALFSLKSRLGPWTWPALPELGLGFG